VQASDGSAGTPSFSFDNDTNTGIYRIGTDQLGFSTGGSLRVTIDNNGLLLYGTREVGFRGAETNSQAGASYSLVNADNGRVVYMTNGGATTVTADQLSANSLVTVVNNSNTNNITLAQGSGVTLILAGTTTTGNRTIGVRGICTLFYASATAAFVSGAGVS
jgi:hypothetical protein